MPKFRLNKLVRDKIVDSQIKLGEKPVYRHLSPDEHRQQLIRKIREEAGELATADSADLASEIADVKQALEDFAAICGVAPSDIAQAQQAKVDKSGGFLEGIYLETVETQADDPWTTYYQGDPERFPEIL